MMTTVQRMIVLLLGLLLTTGLAYAELEKTLVKSQPLDKAPLDIAQSVADGRLFVLLAGGEVQIFSVDGQQQERFQVGDDITSLEVSPDGQMLYLGSTKSKALRFIELSYVQVLPVNNSAVKGAENAPVTITVFDDFECPYCARLVPTLEQVMAAYPRQVRLVYKHFPLSMHKFANSAAIASIAARNQGKFWPLHDELFANYNNLNDVKIRQLAEGVGLDMARFDQDIANPALQQEVAADMQLGSMVGVRGTPAVYINGVQLKDRSFAGFKQVIDAELKKAPPSK
ncbi:MAG: thioredoxin domain-containing protein [Desulfuromonadales bacterium]